jgi:hypothetical protein
LLPIFAANAAYVCVREWKHWRTTMTDKKTLVQDQKPQQQASPGQTDLQHRYAAIGIEAVAAACRYSNPGKRVEEPVRAPRIDQRFEQAN